MKIIIKIANDLTNCRTMKEKYARSEEKKTLQLEDIKIKDQRKKQRKTKKKHKITVRGRWKEQKLNRY